MSLQHNLMLAEFAVNYTKEKMTKGASNKPEDLVHSSMRHATQNWLMRAVTQPDLTAASVPDQRSAIAPRLAEAASVHEKALMAADEVENSGIGNCGEQASVAYKYLFNRSDADLFVLAGLGRNHEFVIIGASADQVRGLHPISVAPNWPADAVICDPWYHEWFAVAVSWPGKIRQILAKTEPDWHHLQVEITPRIVMKWNRVS